MGKSCHGGACAVDGERRGEWFEGGNIAKAICRGTGVKCELVIARLWIAMV
jgi:hypothetical protein